MGGRSVQRGLLSREGLPSAVFWALPKTQGELLVSPLFKRANKQEAKPELGCRRSRQPIVDMRIYKLT